MINIHIDQEQFAALVNGKIITVEAVDHEHSGEHVSVALHVSLGKMIQIIGHAREPFKLEWIKGEGFAAPMYSTDDRKRSDEKTE